MVKEVKDFNQVSKHMSDIVLSHLIRKNWIYLFVYLIFDSITIQYRLCTIEWVRDGWGMGMGKKLIF